MSYRPRRASDPGFSPMPAPSFPMPRRGSLGARSVVPIDKDDQVGASLDAKRVDSLAVDVLAKESRSVNVDLSARNITHGKIQILVHGKALYFSATSKGKNVPVEYEKDFLKLNIALLEAVFSKEDIHDRGIVPTQIDYESGIVYFRDKMRYYGKVEIKKPQSIIGRLKDNSLLRTVKSFLPGTPNVAIANLNKAIDIRDKLKGVSSMFEQYMTGTRRVDKPSTTTSGNDDDQDFSTPLLPAMSSTRTDSARRPQSPPPQQASGEERLLAQLRNPHSELEIEIMNNYMRSLHRRSELAHSDNSLPVFKNLGVLVTNPGLGDHIPLFNAEYIAQQSQGEDLIAFTVLSQHHYCSVFIDKRKGYIHFFDPKGFSHTSRERAHYGAILQELFLRLFNDPLEEGRIPLDRIIDIHPERQSADAPCIQQYDSNNCGVLCLEFIEKELTQRLIHADEMQPAGEVVDTVGQELKDIYTRELDDIFSEYNIADENERAYWQNINDKRRVMADKLAEYQREIEEQHQAIAIAAQEGQEL